MHEADFNRGRWHKRNALLPSGRALEAVGAVIPFGTEPDGSTLSDHHSFTVAYGLRPLALSPREVPLPAI